MSFIPAGNMPLALSMISALGAGIAGKDSPAAALNTVTQNAIGANSAKKEQEGMMMLLKDFLNPETKSSATIDGSGISLKGISPDLLKSTFGLGADEMVSKLGKIGMSNPETVNGVPTTAPIRGGLAASPENPTQNLPQVSPASLVASSSKLPIVGDVAGLTPTDVNNIFTGKLQAFQLLAELEKMHSRDPLQEAQIRKIEAEIKRMEKPDELSELDKARINNLNLKNQKLLKGDEGKEKETERIRTIKALMSMGLTQEQAIEQSGYRPPDYAAEQDTAKSVVAARNYFVDPKSADDLNKFLKDNNTTILMADDSAEAKRALTIQFYNSKIASGNGVIKDAQFSDTGAKVRVLWPDGESSTVTFTFPTE